MAGFTKFDNALLQKILASQLTKRQLKILLLVIRFSAGYQKPYAVLRQRDFQCAGLSPTCIRQELGKLVAMRVVRWDIKRDLVWVNPALRQWDVTSVSHPSELFFTVAAKNSAKWQISLAQNANVSVPEMASANRKKEKDSGQRGTPGLVGLLKEYFLKVAPLTAQEVLVLQEILEVYDQRTVREAVNRMPVSDHRSFSVFLKTVDDLSQGPRRDGRLTTLRERVGPYRASLPE